MNTNCKLLCSYVSSLFWKSQILLNFALYGIGFATYLFSWLYVDWSGNKYLNLYELIL